MNTLKPFEIKTHNGIITITSNKTGDHRTVRIQTVREGNLQGKRVVSLLTGPDNINNYKGFGFVDEDGEILLWKKCRTEFFIRLSRMVSHPELYLEKAKFLFEGKCLRCNHVLTNPLSIQTGLGPECRKQAS